MSVNVEFTFIGKEPIKIASNPDRWLYYGDPWKVGADDAEALLMGRYKGKFTVRRDPHGILGEVYTPIPSGGKATGRTAKGEPVKEARRRRKETE